LLKIIHDLATSSLSKETKQKEKVGELAEMAKCEEERERDLDSKTGLLFYWMGENVLLIKK